MKFSEHIYSEVIEDTPHRHTVFTIPKRLRVFFEYDRKLNTILFRAAWGALSQALGMGDRELAAIFTIQTAGEALNYHPHLHGLLADGCWKDGVFTRFEVVDLAAIKKAFAERVLARLLLSLSSSIPWRLSMKSPPTTHSSRRLMTSKTRFLCDGKSDVYLPCYFSRLSGTS